MPKKILIDLSYIRTKPFSGVAKYAYRIIDFIIESGRVSQYALLLDVISGQEIKKRYPQFETVTIGVNFMMKFPVIRTYWLQYRFKKVVDSSNFDIVFCPWANEITCGKSRKKIVSVIHDLQSLIDWRGLALYRDKYIFNAVIRNSHKIVTISEFSKRQIISLFPEAKVDNLGNSVSVDTTDLPDVGYPRPYILYVGRLSKMKNVITLVRGFCRISNKYGDLKLVIVGQKNKYWEDEVVPVINSMADRNRIEVLESVSEKQLTTLYRDAEIFVFPSLREGFGSPPVEASIMGTPVISTKSDSLEEVSLGLWFTYDAPLDDKELARVMTDVLENRPSKERLAHIKDEMIRHYSTSTVCSNICNYLEAL